MIKISVYILFKNYNHYNDFISISYFISLTIVILKGLQKLITFFIHQLKRKCHKIKNALSIYRSISLLAIL